MMTKRSSLLAVLLLAVVPAAHATYTPPPACNNPFTPQQEVTEGAKVAAQVYQQMPVLPANDPVSRYISQLGLHLASHAPGLKWPFTYRVVASSDINAFALPGGSIFVNMGTIQAAQTEAQLAGVLAHETSHVVLRHATCNMKKQQTPGIIAGIASIASSIWLGNGVGGQIAQTAIGGGFGLYGLRMSRDDEKQADLLGTDILYNTGYDPRGMSQFFEIIEAKYGAGGVQMLTDHPNPGNRTEYVNAEIATLPRLQSPLVTSAPFQRAHDAAMHEQAFSADQIKQGSWKNGAYASGPNAASPVYGNQTTGNQNTADNSTNGQYDSNAPVPLNRTQVGLGSRMQTYRGPNFLIDHPSNWQVSGSAQSGVTLAPVGGAGTFGLAYGAIVGTVQVDSAITDSDGLANATQQLAQQLSQQNGGLQQLSVVQQLNVNGHLADGLDMRGRSPVVQNGSTSPEREWLVTITSDDGDLHTIVFVAPERDFAQLKPLFQRMLNSFRPQ
jgi:Zn-dependent protease with chaperone function